MKNVIRILVMLMVAMSFFDNTALASDNHHRGANETGTDNVYAFAKSTRPLRRAYATLLRDGDTVRAVVKTRLGATR